MGTGGRDADLARSLACVGRNDDALTELEALLNEGYTCWRTWRSIPLTTPSETIPASRPCATSSRPLTPPPRIASAHDRSNDADIDSLGA